MFPQALGPPPREDSGLLLHLQRLESTLSVCAEEPDHSQLFTHLGRMALEFNRLASKVHKNEQRTSILQVSGLGAAHLCLASEWWRAAPAGGGGSIVSLSCGIGAGAGMLPL